jgi:hypothetical protein
MAEHRMHGRLYVWGSGWKHGRADYDSDDHAFEDMCHEKYFAAEYHQLRAGDYIYITDRDKRLFEVMVDEIDAEEKLVRFSLMRERTFLPVGKKEDGGYAVRWRGPRHKWCVFDKHGEPIEREHPNRDKAERAIELILAKKAA